ncbi:26934_t:CDS:1, partial [Gigaspora margarita]
MDEIKKITFKQLTEFTYVNSDEKITEKDLVDLKETIIEAATNLKITTLSLKSCFVEETENLDQNFLNLRNSVATEARLYSDKILPFANEIVKTIQKFCE